MTFNDAKKAAEMFRTIGGFAEVKVEHFGWVCWESPEETEAARADDKWYVELWSVNAKAGNRTLTRVDALPSSDREAKLIAKAAKGKATERDRAAMARMRAEREVNAE